MEIEQRKRERSPSSTSEGGKSPRRGKTETERREGGETDGGELSEFVKQLLITELGPKRSLNNQKTAFSSPVCSLLTISLPQCLRLSWRNNASTRQTPRASKRQTEHENPKSDAASVSHSSTPTLTEHLIPAASWAVSFKAPPTTDRVT